MPSVFNGDFKVQNATFAKTFPLKYCMLESMLEHQKMVLSGVEDHSQLFRKELLKSLSWLDDKEQLSLEKWVRKNYYHLHSKTIDEVFRGNPPEAS